LPRTFLCQVSRSSHCFHDKNPTAVRPPVILPNTLPHRYLARLLLSRYPYLREQTKCQQ
jgi:hypothetical protein